MTNTPQELRIPPITVGVRLKLAREMAGYDQRELAAALGIATRSVQNYEHGHTQPKRPVLVVWAMTTGVPLSWLTEGEMPPPTCPSCGHMGEPAEDSRSRCSPAFMLVSNPNPTASDCEAPTLAIV